jgi:hypothetical protein
MALILGMLLLLTILQHIRPGFFENLPGKAYSVMLLSVVGVSAAEFLIAFAVAGAFSADRQAGITAGAGVEGILALPLIYGILIGLPFALLGARKPDMPSKTAAWYMFGIQVGLVALTLLVFLNIGVQSDETVGYALIGIAGPVFVLAGTLGAGLVSAAGLTLSSGGSEESSRLGAKLIGLILLGAGVAQAAQFVWLGRWIWRRFGHVTPGAAPAVEDTARQSR